MKQHRNRVWLTYAKQSFIESLIAMLLFYAIYLGKSTELVRGFAGDTAFSYLNSLVFSGIESNDSLDTPVVVYKVDKTYLKDTGLWDEHNESTYGSQLPRSIIATFIDRLDTLPKEKQPLAFFIDYDMESGSSSFDMKEKRLWISDDDKIFLDTLAKERSYPILLPKTSHRNFVEEYAKQADGDATSKMIAQKIDKEKIIFVDVEFLVSDHTAYRYNPMKQYETDDKIYYSVSLVLWQLSKKKDSELRLKEIDELYAPEEFTDQNKVKKQGAALFLSNILYKQGTIINADDGEEIFNWTNLRALSAYHLMRVKDPGLTPETIVILGHDDKKQDLHNTTLGKKVSGALVHAQAIETVLFLDGKLEYLSLFISFIIIFITFFTVTLLVRYYMQNMNELIKFFTELILLVTILLAISSYVLVEYKQWFNWFIPIIIFYVDDMVMLMRQHWKQNKDATKETE